MSVSCGECGSAMVLRSSCYGRFYGCSRYPDCRGTHGADPNGQPLGKPADKATKAARMRAHDAFDRLWKSGAMTRRDAYRWMRKHMELPGKECHIALFDADQCERLIALVTHARPADISTEAREND